MLLNIAGEPEQTSEYVLGPGDVVKVSVYQLDTLGQERTLTLTVGDDGTIPMPLIGAVQADGRVPSALEEVIRRKLAKDFIHNPRVKLRVAEHRSRVAAVMGAVHRPGRYPVYGRAVSLLDLMGRAGGMTDGSDDEVRVVRGALRTDRSRGVVPDADPSRNSFTVRLSRLVHEGARAAPVLIFPGDLVSVSQRGSSRFYVTGHVSRPGSYYRAPDMTLLQALTVAGGLRDTADPFSLKIVRQRPRGGEELIKVNLKDIVAGKLPDVRVRPADLVVVPSTPGRRVRADVRRFFQRLFSVGVDARYNVID
jgi:polysaccharide export outer membrane protein